MASYSITISGIVPVIAWCRDGRLFCNAANGYQLYAHDTITNHDRLLDESSGPVDKPFTPSLLPTETLRLDAKP